MTSSSVVEPLEMQASQHHEYFGLDDQAFSIAVNPRYLYMSDQHREALAHLLFGVKSGGFVMLSGEVGTGKTTIIRCLLEQLPDTADLAIVMNPSASARDLLCSICDEFRLTYAPNETSLKNLTDTLTEFLVKNHMRERKSIVLIDEAQLLRISTLEQVRLLTNLETNTQKLLQIILVGQPELNELLAKPALRQLSQRITARYHLRPLTDKDTGAYIKHRLKIAGMPPGRIPFTPKIIAKIHQVSRGIPRLINILCDRMLLGAYSKDVAEVDAEVCKQAVIEVMGAAPQENVQFADANQKFVYAGAGAAGAFVFALLMWFVLDGNDAPTILAESRIDQEPEQVLPVATPTSQKNERSQASPAVDTWLRDKDQAIALLTERLGISLVQARSPCWVVSQKGYQCETERAPTWAELRDINRPAVLTIQTSSRRRRYMTLVGLREDAAWVVSAAGDVQQMDLDSIGQMWTGEFLYIWARPEAFMEAIGLGSRTPLVSWVARQFASLDNQATPLAKETFNKELRARVKIFQRSYGLKDDGFVGQKTLLRLNEALGYDVALSDFDVLAVEHSSQGQL